MDFLFHKVSEEEKKEIQKQARGIMDSFSKQLSKIDKKLRKQEEAVERDDYEREESGKEDIKEDKSFSREIMFKNAPNKNKDFIIAEKGKW